MKHSNSCPQSRLLFPILLFGFGFYLSAILASQSHAASLEKGALIVDSISHSHFHFDGFLGKRIDANIDNWLLLAPPANPGMLEIFRLRDRKPEPNLVPWAGEFVGKYLISAIQAIRMSDDPKLQNLVGDVISELTASQAEDGYLGPFPKAVRLKANWDLWGHYHCMLALLMWYESTGDEKALTTCRRAADLICHTFMDGSMRVFDAGSQEMNMAVIHSLGWLYRITGETRYLNMMMEIIKDWERAGDYLRTGLSKLEYYQTPKPRWESLHDLQGLVELYRITGEAKYRDAFLHHWRSILHWDRRNTGAFSSGEQATGNPFAPTPIETCCTTAWMAITLDALRLTGDPQAADELELSTWNASVGSQHPSGRWWTYNTPMDGVRESSTHTIVFQSRAGTPELNCCAVNGPRGLGMLSEWAVMSATDSLWINYYGAGKFDGKFNKTPITIRWDTDYPLSGKVQIYIEPEMPSQFTLKLRIPAWSKETRVLVNSETIPNISAGSYAAINRVWKKGDSVTLELDMRIRYALGEKEAAGKVTLYRGPLLLAYDQRFNAFDEEAIPKINLKQLNDSKIVSIKLDESAFAPIFQPWILIEVPGSDGRIVKLCDFANAGAVGTHYRSWLPMVSE